MPTPDELRARAETDMLAADTAEAVRQMDADPAHPHTGLVVQPYRDHGVEKWVFRCWGTDTCDGWLSLDHTSQQWAEAARDRHLAEDHKEQPMPTEKPDCTATIDGPHIPGDSPVSCTRKVHVRGNHHGPKGPDGQLMWNDHHAGAVPHGASSKEG